MGTVLGGRHGERVEERGSGVYVDVEKQLECTAISESEVQVA